MPYRCSHNQTDDRHGQEAIFATMSHHIGKCIHYPREHSTYAEESILASSPLPVDYKASLDGKRTFLDGIREGKRLQLAMDRTYMEEYRFRLRSFQKRIQKEHNQLLADIVNRHSAFQAELDDICAMADLEEDDGEYQQDSGEDNGIKEQEEGNDDDSDSVVESDGVCDEEEGYGSFQETDDEELSCREQGDETDVSSDDEEECFGVEPDIHTKAIPLYPGYDIYDTTDGEKDSRRSYLAKGIALRCGYLDFPSDDDSEEDDFNPDINILDLAILIEDAHEPENVDELALVKRHIQHAERTHRDQRTLAQLYLFHHWRSPTHLPLRRPTPELYVDASQFGIGLYLGTRWLAWTFKHGHPAIKYNSDGNIDTSWSELIAVEIGVSTVFAEAYGNTPISIWSDNKGVVDALINKKWTGKKDLEDILGRILNRCEEYGFDIRPKWIPSSMNPADNASRGAYPPKKMMLDRYPYLPRRLGKVVKRVDLKSE